jgi:hypothetical protein
MKHRKSPRRIELYVMADYPPGSYSWSRVEAAASTSDGTTVTYICGDQNDKKGQVLYAVKEETSDCFRGLVSALTDDDAEGGIDASALDHVKVTWLDGWKADFAKFCWVCDSEFDAPLALDFIGFDDWHLEQLYAHACHLSDLYKSREKAWSPAFYDSYWRLRDDRDQVDDLREKTLPEIVRHMGLDGRCDFWEVMVSAVHSMANRVRSERKAADEKRAIELAPILAFAKRAHYPRVGGALAGIGNGLRSKGVVEYVESYMKRTGRYPTGPHIVPYQTGLSSAGSRTSPPTSTMEVLFPNDPDDSAT